MKLSRHLLLGTLSNNRYGCVLLGVNVIVRVDITGKSPSGDDIDCLSSNVQTELSSTGIPLVKFGAAIISHFELNQFIASFFVPI